MPEWVESILSSSVSSKLCKYTFDSFKIKIVQIHFQLKAQGWGAPPPHAKPGNPGGKSRARGIKPHVMFSYVWIYGSKMCTLHTNVSSKTPSRSPQGSRPVVGGDSECLAKIEFLNLGGQLFVRYDCYPNNNEERNWHAAALNWLVSIFVELQALRLFSFFPTQWYPLPLLETVGAFARPISVYLQLFARQSLPTKGSPRFKW